MENQTAESLEAIKRFLPRLIEACGEIEQKFYEPISDSFWLQFADIVQGMDDLYRTLNTVSKSMKMTHHYAAIVPYIELAAAGLSAKFQLLNQFVDEEYYVGASDILKFELIPLFQQLSVGLGEEEDVLEQRFQANISFLREQFPNVFAEISLVAADRSRYQTIYCRNGSPNLCAISDNDKLIYLYSRFNPAQEVNRWVETIADSIEGKSDIMIYGFGLGYHAKALAEKCPEKRLTIYEPDEQLLLASMRLFDFRAFFGELNIFGLVIGKKKHQRDRMFYRFLKHTINEPQIVVVPFYYRLDKTDMEQFSADAQLAIANYSSSLLMYKKFGWEWLSNSLFNMAATLSSPSILGLKNKFKGKTAVVAGAGPSLSEDIESLRVLKNHALIIAAGSTIQSLLHYGIEPHLIVSMDGGEPNYEALKGLKIQHIPFLYTPMIKYRIIDEQADNLLHVHFTNDAVTRSLMDITTANPLFPPNHSVTGTAIQAAIYLGCEEIILTGQDLSFPGEHFYAPGARHLSKEVGEHVLGRATQLVENVRGGMNRTNTGMITTLADIEELLADHPEVRFTNTTSKGAKIKNTTWEPMTEVLRRLQDSRLEEDALKKEMTGLQSYDKRQIKMVCDRMIQLPDNMRVSVERLERIDRYIGRAQELCRKNPKRCFDTFIEIDKIWRSFVGDFSFKALYFILFRNELNSFERDLPLLANETNMVKKSELAREIMRPVVRKMLDMKLELSNVVLEAVRRIQMYMSINGGNQNEPG